MKKFLSVFLVCVLMMNFNYFNSSAIETTRVDYSNSTVLVTLKKEYSIPGTKYSNSFFDENLFSNVEDLTNYNPNKKGKGGHNSENWRISLCLTLKSPGFYNIEKAIKVLSQHDAVEDVSRNYIGYVAATSYTIPNDPYFAYQYGLDFIEAKRAWSLTKGLFSVKVAVIDTGINRNNPDLTTNTNSSLAANFVSETSELYWHGTHVSGILGANSNNNSGVTGVCWNCTIVDLRVSNSSSVYVSNVVSAINYATENDIPLLNISIGFSNSTTQLSNAISDYDGLIVAAAGNTGNSTVLYPAAYAYNKIISVTATGTSDTFYTESSYHPNIVEVAAPGEDIYSTVGNSYAYASGTSMATPYVTGIALLIMSVNPDLTPVQIKRIIMSTVDTIPSLEGKCSTGGRVNAFKAVMKAGGYILGDVDLNGTITAVDAQLAMQLSVNSISLPMRQVVLADYDGNGTVDAGDSRAILRISTGLSPYMTSGEVE